MKYRDTFFLLFATAVASSSLVGIAASGYGASALHAQAAGFDALAYEVFGGSACLRADQATGTR